MFLGSGLAFMLMPLRGKAIWDSSSPPEWEVPGIPAMTIIAAGFCQATEWS